MCSDRKSTLLELAGRCEAAEGADRELDAHIRRAVYGDFGFCGDHDGTTYHGECPPEGCGKPVSMCDDRTSHPSDWRDDDALPRYTASLDAAMSLVPEGWEPFLETDSYRDTPGLFWKWGLGRLTFDAVHGESFGPAAALCAAALRAHAEESWTSALDAPWPAPKQEIRNERQC